MTARRYHSSRLSSTISRTGIPTACPARPPASSSCLSVLGLSFLLSSFSDEEDDRTSRTREIGPTFCCAVWEKRFVRLSVRVSVCPSRGRRQPPNEPRVESATTTSTRACANLAPRTTNRGLESGLARHPCWQMLKSGATSEKLPSYHPLSTATLGKRKLRRAIYIGWRRAPKVLQGKLSGFNRARP